MEAFIAVQQGLQLLGGGFAVACQQHPEVLHCRPHARVVEIDEMRARWGPQDVSRVAVAVQADLPRLDQLEAVFHAVQREIHRADPGFLQILRQQARVEQPVARLVAEGIGIQRRAFAEGPRRADRVDAPEEAADPFQHFFVLELRRPAAAAREDGEAEAGEFVQGFFADHPRGDDGNFALGQLDGKGMVLEDLRVAPAIGAVELRHHVGVVLQAHLVDAVLVAVEREQAPVAAQADALERIQHRVGRQAFIRL